MKPIAKIFTLISLGGLLACQGPKNEEPPRPRGESDHLTAAVLWLQKGETARLAREQAYHYAWLLLEKQLETGLKADSLAVVLDLDETVVDNAPYEARIIQDGGKFEPETWSEWVQEAQADLIPGAFQFLSKADSAGFQIFYISNRSVENLGPTLENLIALQVPQADSNRVLLRSESSDKTARREQVRETFTIALLVGDQLGDFSAEFASAEAKLQNKIVVIPNPMYGDFLKLPDSIKQSQLNLNEALKGQLNPKR